MIVQKKNRRLDQIYAKEHHRTKVRPNVKELSRPVIWLGILFSLDILFYRHSLTFLEACLRAVGLPDYVVQADTTAGRESYVRHSKIPANMQRE